MHLEVSKKTDLAIRALQHLHQRSGQSTGSEMAEAIDTTLNYLPQIMKPLIMAGWVASSPGPGGGYALGTRLSAISVFEVIRAMEGEMQDDRCVLRGTPCPAQEQCALHTSWLRARSALLAELGATSLEAALAPGS